MPMGANKQTDAICRTASASIMAVHEQEDTTFASLNRRKSVLEGAKAPMNQLDASGHSENAIEASEARWKKETDMIQDQSPKSKLAAIYAAKKEAGLVDVKFLVGSIDEASFDDVANEVLRLEEAVKRKDYRVIRFNDKH